MSVFPCSTAWRSLTHSSVGVSGWCKPGSCREEGGTGTDAHARTRRLNHGLQQSLQYTPVSRVCCSLVTVAVRTMRSGSRAAAAALAGGSAAAAGGSGRRDGVLLRLALLYLCTSSVLGELTRVSWTFCCFSRRVVRRSWPCMDTSRERACDVSVNFSGEGVQKVQVTFMLLAVTAFSSISASVGSV